MLVSSFSDAWKAAILDRWHGGPTILLAYSLASVADEDYVVNLSTEAAMRVMNESHLLPHGLERLLVGFREAGLLTPTDDEPDSEGLGSYRLTIPPGKRRAP